jgi:rubrerythrin
MFSEAIKKLEAKKMESKEKDAWVCDECGAEVPENACFCPYCGVEFEDEDEDEE